VIDAIGVSHVACVSGEFWQAAFASELTRGGYGAGATSATDGDSSRPEAEGAYVLGQVCDGVALSSSVDSRNELAGFVWYVLTEMRLE
jgi:hypothetical protein